MVAVWRVRVVRVVTVRRVRVVWMVRMMVMARGFGFDGAHAYISEARADSPAPAALRVAARCALYPRAAVAAAVREAPPMAYWYIAGETEALIGGRDLGHYVGREYRVV